MTASSANQASGSITVNQQSPEEAQTFSQGSIAEMLNRLDKVCSCAPLYIDPLGGHIIHELTGSLETRCLVYQSAIIFSITC